MSAVFFLCWAFTTAILVIVSNKWERRYHEMERKYYALRIRHRLLTGERDEDKWTS